jgi:hypothetical protein
MNKKAPETIFTELKSNSERKYKVTQPLYLKVCA